jgi:hypothetical protein
MADHADDDGVDGDIFEYNEDGVRYVIFIYRGGRAPQHVTHVIIDKSVEVIEENAFSDCICLVQVETHDGITKVGNRAFFNCGCLTSIKLKSTVEIGDMAFFECGLKEVEFGDKLETIGTSAFVCCCGKLERLKLPSVIAIETEAFFNNRVLTDVELSERLEKIGTRGFYNCRSLQRIAFPLKRDLFSFRRKYNQFDRCEQLVTVDLVGVGGIHKTVASFHMECWRIEMIAEIDRINLVLPTTPANEKTAAIKQWMDSVIDKMDHYKEEHHRYVKEATTLLELALWKSKLVEIECSLEPEAKKAKIDADNARMERRVTSGAGTVIKNVLPFLQLK